MRNLNRALALLLLALPLAAQIHPSKQQKEAIAVGVAVGVVFNEPIRKGVKIAAVKGVLPVAKHVFRFVTARR